MSAKQLPTPDEAVEAVSRLLTAIETEKDVLDELDQIGSLHPKYNTFPGEIFMRLAADALDDGGVSRESPISEERLLRNTFLSVSSGGETNKRCVTPFSLRQAGFEVDLLDEVAYWGTDDLWTTPGQAGRLLDGATGSASA